MMKIIIIITIIAKVVPCKRILRDETFTCKWRMSSISPVSELSSVLARTCNLKSEDINNLQMAIG